MNRLVAVALALLPVSSLRGETLVLDLVTKLGAEVRAECIIVQAPELPISWFDAHGIEIGLYGRNTLGSSKLALRLAKKAYVLAPWLHVKSFQAGEKKQVLTLRDGAMFSGQAATKVLTRERKTYELGSIDKMTVVKVPPIPKDGERKVPKAQPATLRLHEVNATLPNVVSMFFFPLQQNGDIASTGITSGFTISVGGESIQGNWLDYDRVEFAPANAAGKFEVRIRGVQGKMTSGPFLLPKLSDGAFGFVPTDWWFTATNSAGATLLFKGGFALERKRN